MKATVLLPLLFSACMQVPVNYPVYMTDLQWDRYWSQVGPRMNRWFDGNDPELPTMNELRESVLVIEVPVGEINTCDFQAAKMLIRIQADRWESGCVAHEFGHAALWMIDHDCWNEFEHPNENYLECG